MLWSARKCKIVHMVVIIIIITGKTVISQPCPSLEHCTTFVQSVFISSDFTTVILLQSKVVSLASDLQHGGPGFCIYVPQ
jgi:hypothetical protein